jgi:type III secretory pathway component EscS
MKYLLLILLAPLLLVCNLVGAVAALVQVGVINGYVYTMELIEKTQKEKL